VEEADLRSEVGLLDLPDTLDEGRRPTRPRGLRTLGTIVIESVAANSKISWQASAGCRQLAGGPTEPRDTREQAQFDVSPPATK